MAGPNDFNILDHLGKQGVGFSGQPAQAQAGDGLANEKETPEIIFEGLKKVPGTTAKLLEAIPIIGALLSKLVPLNAGEVSAVSSLETQGLAGKSINPGKGGITGGTLYNAVFAPLIKNSAITDQTGGTGGDASGGGGSDFASGGAGGGGDFGGGAGGGGSGGDFIDNSHFERFASASNSFEWSAMSLASLGGLPRPITPDMTSGPELGVA